MLTVWQNFCWDHLLSFQPYPTDPFVPGFPVINWAWALYAGPASAGVLEHVFSDLLLPVPLLWSCLVLRKLPSRAVLLRYLCAHRSLEILVKQSSDSVDLEEDLRLCICNSLTGSTALVHGPHFELQDPVFKLGLTWEPPKKFYKMWMLGYQPQKSWFNWLGCGLYTES